MALTNGHVFYSIFRAHAKILDQNSVGNENFV